MPTNTGLTQFNQSQNRVIFGAPKAIAEPRATAAPVNVAVKTARPEIDQAIQTVAFKFARQRPVAEAGLSTREFHALFRANIQIESGFNHNAKSAVGAIGLGQLMPETAKDLGVNPYDMVQNLEGSARYLVQMLALFGTKELALAAYNAGPAAVQKHGGIPPYKETQNHVRKVVAVFHQTLKS